jgi:hypothetical protein
MAMGNNVVDNILGRQHLIVKNMSLHNLQQARRYIKEHGIRDESKLTTTYSREKRNGGTETKIRVNGVRLPEEHHNILAKLADTVKGDDKGMSYIFDIEKKRRK